MSDLQCEGCETWCADNNVLPKCSEESSTTNTGLIFVTIILAVLLLASSFVLFFAKSKLNRIFSDPRNIIVSEISEERPLGKNKSRESLRNIGAHVVVDNSPIIRDRQEDADNNQQDISVASVKEKKGAAAEGSQGALLGASSGEGHVAIEMKSEVSATQSSSNHSNQSNNPESGRPEEEKSAPSGGLNAPVTRPETFQSMHAEARIASNRRGSIGEKIMRRLSISAPPNEKEYSWEINIKDLKFRKKIGEGGYGTIYLGEWLGTEVAIKTVKQALCKRETFLNEVQIMSTLHHPNIVIFMGASLNEKNICMVMEYMEKGDMQQFLKNKDNKPLISMHLMHRFAIDIARGMKYLHHRVKMIQRDLKSDNLLIDGNYNCKICDFGLTRYIDVDGHMTACGTPYWTAPEVIRQETFDHKADVFSYGIVLWELLTQKEPYGGMEGIKVAYAVADSGLRPNIPSVCPEGWDDLMQECWHDNPEFRPDFGVILDRLVELKKDYENIDFVPSGEESKTSLGAHRKSVVRTDSKSSS